MVKIPVSFRGPPAVSAAWAKVFLAVTFAALLAGFVILSDIGS